MVIGGPHNTPLMQALAEQRMTQTVDLYRSPPAIDGKRGPMELHTAALPIHLYEPNTTAALTLLNDLGSARANWIGEVSAGSDVLEGDELRGVRIFTVDRVIGRPDLTFLALWEIHD